MNYSVFSEARKFLGLGPPRYLTTALYSHPDITVPKPWFEVQPIDPPLGSLSWGGGVYPAVDC